jgi:hypothetical protein
MRLTLIPYIVFWNVKITQSPVDKLWKLGGHNLCRK